MRFGLMTLTVIAGAAFASPALADGLPPFYGYSPYLGGPVTYYTPDSDVHQASIVSQGLPGMGTRTYARGGPFFTYQSAARKRPAHPGRRRAVLVTKG